VGDSKRHSVFAEFIVRTFPDAKTVADVAGGRGGLSFRLWELGIESVIIDPREVRFPHRIRRALRKKSIQEGRIVDIRHIRKDVRDVDLGEFDLIAGLHPDDATEPALRAAAICQKDFAIVPCCVFPMDGVKRSREEWFSYLASLVPGTNVTTLPIEGANEALWKRTRRD